MRCVEFVCCWLLFIVFSRLFVVSCVLLVDVCCSLYAVGCLLVVVVRWLLCVDHLTKCVVRCVLFVVC